MVVPTGGPAPVSDGNRAAPATRGQAATARTSSHKPRQRGIFIPICASSPVPPAGATRASRQRADGADGTAQHHRQPPHGSMVGPAQRRHRHPRGACQPRPSRRSQAGRLRMAGRRKSRREEGEIGARVPGAAQLGPGMGGAGQPTASRAGMARPASAAQMHAGPQRRRQSHVARHYQRQPAGAANARQGTPQHRPPRIAVMTQHHPCQPTWQPGDRGTRVGQPALVGEQP